MGTKDKLGCADREHLTLITKILDDEVRDEVNKALVTNYISNQANYIASLERKMQSIAATQAERDLGFSLPVGT